MRFIDEGYTRRPFYGSRRMKGWFCGLGHKVSRNRVKRLMQVMWIEAVYPKPKLSQPGEAHKIYPYLLKGVEVTRVSQVWNTDVTCIRMAEGFVYLVASDQGSQFTSKKFTGDLETHGITISMDGPGRCFDNIVY